MPRLHVGAFSYLSFVDRFLKRGVLLVVDRFHLLHQPKKHAEKIQLQAGLLEHGHFLHLVRLAREEDVFEYIENDGVASLPNGVPVLLRNAVPIPIEGLVKFVGFFEDRNVEIVHGLIFL